MCAFLIGCFSVFAVVSFDFQPTIHNWITQHWAQHKMRRARAYGCISGTADTLCSIPTVGYPYANQVS